MEHGFIDPSVDGFAHQEANFCLKIGNYSFDQVTPAEIVEVKADSTYLTWEITTRDAYISYGKSWTKYEDELIHGPNAGANAVAPPLPTITAAPPSVKPGMRDRFSNIAANCKRSTGFTNAMGTDLDIVAFSFPDFPAMYRASLKLTPLGS